MLTQPLRGFWKPRAQCARDAPVRSVGFEISCPPLLGGPRRRALLRTIRSCSIILERRTASSSSGTNCNTSLQRALALKPSSELADEARRALARDPAPAICSCTRFEPGWPPSRRARLVILCTCLLCKT